MHKKLLLLVAMVFSLVIFAPASAQVQPEKFSTLVDAARFFPSSTPFYFSIRTDVGYINTLNDVFLAVQERTVGSAITLSDGLDLLFQDLLSTDFQDDVAPWLGDYIAFGVLPPDSLTDYSYSNDDVEYALLVKITDRALALDYLEAGLAGERTLETTDAYDAFYPEFYPNGDVYLVTDNHLVITNSSKFIPPTDVRGSLLGSYAFEDALNAMPADAYNFVVYVDIPTIQSYAMTGSDYTPKFVRAQNLLLAQMMGPIAVAGKIENGNVLILDSVSSAGNMTLMEQLGISMPPNLVVNPEFTAYIPADSIFALQGVSPVQYGDYFRTTLESVWRYLSASEFNPQYDAEIQEMVAQGTAAFGRVADAVVSGFTGMSLERDFGNWMSRDFVWFMRSNPELDNPNFPIDTALVFQVTDGAQSVESMRNLVRALPLALRTMGVRGVAFREDTLEGADALFIDIYGYEVSDKPAFQLVISANESVFAIGTERAVAESLRGGAGGAFALSQAYILPNATSVLYDSAVNAIPLTRWIVAQDRNNPNGQLIEAIVNVLGEGVISSTMLEDGTTISRTVQILNLGR
ncbi:MAG: DUF3352 domain-containing protein [Anaerolineae bacterium]|nr:DUF3352 domain-containing protein [Anaerolineae bacterium]